MMLRAFWTAVLVLGVLGPPMPAQRFPPGYVDPAPLLAAAAAEIGEANLKCITFAGTGYAGAVGQTFENAVNIDWPRIERPDQLHPHHQLGNGDQQRDIRSQPGLNPASWKYGLGWQGGTPMQKVTRQTHIVSGDKAWHMDGDGPPVAVPPELAELYRLDLWLNPPGFLKAARLPGANPIAFWRWEQIEKGRDGNVVTPEQVHVVAITMFGKYRVDATINSRNQIQRIKTTVSEPALGDFNIEHESTNQIDVRQREVADRLAFAPGMGRQLAVLPPEHRPQRLRRASSRTCSRTSAPIRCPCRRRWPRRPSPLTRDRRQDGQWRLPDSAAAPANSYLVEFDDFVAVFEAPGNEARSLAVIEQIAKLAPDKPIRWLISSHPHFDHIGGLRTYLHIGATIVAHMNNIAFLNRDVLNYEPRTVAPDIVSRWPPTEVAEGYNYEAVQENYVITDDTRILHVYYVQPLQHVAGHADGVPAGRAHRVQADLFDTHEPPRAAQLPAMRSLATQVERMKLACRHRGAGARQAGAVEHVCRRPEGPGRAKVTSVEDDFREVPALKRSPHDPGRSGVCRPVDVPRERCRHRGGPSVSGRSASSARGAVAGSAGLRSRQARR